MKEYLPENERPVNQAAKKALRQVNLKPDPEDLYLLQLMEWGLEKKKVALRAPWEVGQEQLEQFHQLRGRPPRQVARVFEENEAGEPSELVALAEKKGPLSAVNLAQEGWEQLDSWLQVNRLYLDSPPLDAGH